MGIFNKLLGLVRNFLENSFQRVVLNAHKTKPKYEMKQNTFYLSYYTTVIFVLIFLLWLSFSFFKLNKVILHFLKYVFSITIWIWLYKNYCLKETYQYVIL